MGSLLIVTGPPGAGKSTVAPLLAASVSPSVLVEGDRFHGFLAAGAIPPWLPESNDQNRVVVEATALATGRFVRDYFTIFDGVIGTWFLPTFLDAAQLGDADARLDIPVDYVVLLPTVEQCVDHVRTRVGHHFNDEDATRTMHHEFASAPVDVRHVIEPGQGSVSDVVAEIQARLRAGSLRVV
jgi:adenylate kinase family enzyme